MAKLPTGSSSPGQLLSAADVTSGYFCYLDADIPRPYLSRTHAYRCVPLASAETLRCRHCPADGNSHGVSDFQNDRRSASKDRRSASTHSERLPASVINLMTAPAAPLKQLWIIAMIQDMGDVLRQSDRLSIFSNVASKLRMDPRHVQRVAAGEVHAPEVDAAIKQEMDELVAFLSSKRRQRVEAAGERRQDTVQGLKSANSRSRAG